MSTAEEGRKIYTFNSFLLTNFLLLLLNYSMKTFLKITSVLVIVLTVGCGKKDSISEPPPSPLDSTQLGTSLKISYSNSKYDSILSVYSHDDKKRVRQIVTTYYYAPFRGAAITDTYVYNTTYVYSGSGLYPSSSLAVSNTTVGFYDSVNTYFYYDGNNKLIKDSVNERLFSSNNLFRFVHSSTYSYTAGSIIRKLSYSDQNYPPAPTYVNTDTATLDANGNVTMNKYYFQESGTSGIKNYSYSNKLNPLSASNLSAIFIGFRRTFEDDEDIISRNNITMISHNSKTGTQTSSRLYQQEGIDLVRADGFLLETKLRMTVPSNQVYIWRYTYKKL